MLTRWSNLSNFVQCNAIIQKCQLYNVKLKVIDDGILYEEKKV
jgi:hypothetical protein